MKFKKKSVSDLRLETGINSRCCELVYGASFFVLKITLIRGKLARFWLQKSIAWIAQIRKNSSHTYKKKALSTFTTATTTLLYEAALLNTFFSVSSASVGYREGRFLS